MTVKPSIDEIVNRILSHAAGRPMWEVMRDDERDAGRAVVVPGEAPWLPADDWYETVVVSRSRKEVRLIALLATHPGTGAFRRMVSGIIAAGLTPVILAPAPDMRAIMKRWGWLVRHVGSGWFHEEQWRPRKGWTP